MLLHPQNYGGIVEVAAVEVTKTNKQYVQPKSCSIRMLPQQNTVFLRSRFIDKQQNVTAITFNVQRLEQIVSLPVFFYTATFFTQGRLTQRLLTQEPCSVPPSS